MIDFLDQGCTINGAYYAGELRRLSQEIARKRQGKLTRGVLLLQNNAPVHMTAATECGFEILSHSPYSPDMAPFELCLFPKLISNLRSTEYGSNECVIEAVNEYLGDQRKAFYFEGIGKLEQRWALCIELKGDNIEKKWSIFHSLVAQIQETANF